MNKSVGLTITDVQVTKGDDNRDILYLSAVGADETPDVDGEIFDYDSSKPYIQNWSANAEETTRKAGQDISYGNIRAQHGQEGSGNAAGTIHEPIEFDDKGKSVRTKVKVVDKDAIHKVLHGVYRGLSVRGRLVGKKWRDGKHYRYTVDPVEFSLVDKPANPNATLTIVKADGTREVFKVGDERTKTVGGKHLTASQFAYVGDPERTDTWKLPIHDASHVRNALARLDQTQGIPDSAWPKVKAKIKRAAKRFGIDAASLEDEKKGAFAGTGMGSIGQLACLLDQLFYLRDTTLFEAGVEDDGSEIPEKLTELLHTAAEILDEMTSEEVEELIEMTDTTKKADERDDKEKAEREKAEREKAEKEKRDREEKEKADRDKEGRFEKAKSHHEKMGEAMAKTHEAHKAGKHEEVKRHLDAMKEHHDGMTEHFGEKPEAEKRKADIANLENKISELTDLVTKMATGGGSQARPIHPGTTVATKAGDGTQTEDLLAKKAALDKNDPQYLDKAYSLDRAAEPELVKI